MPFFFKLSYTKFDSVQELILTKLDRNHIVKRTNIKEKNHKLYLSEKKDRRNYLLINVSFDEASQMDNTFILL